VKKSTPYWQRPSRWSEASEAQDAFWGGYSGYFADPDGFVWEVAWNPFFEIAEDGRVLVPD